MKLFLFVALFAVSANALISVESINAASWGEELQVLLDDVFAIVKARFNGVKVLDATTNTDIDFRAFTPVNQDYDNSKLLGFSGLLANDLSDADKNQFKGKVKISLLRILRAKYSTEYDLAAVSKVISGIDTKWDHLPTEAVLYDGKWKNCLRALIPSMVESAVESALDKTIDEEKIISKVKQLFVDMKADSGFNSGVAAIGTWNAALDAGGDFQFDTYMGLLMDNRVRDKLLVNIKAKAGQIAGQITGQTPEGLTQFYEILSLNVRSSLTKAIKEARDLTVDDLNDAFNAALKSADETPKFGASNEDVTSQFYPSGTEWSQKTWDEDRLSAEWAVVFFEKLHNELTEVLGIDKCAVDMIMDYVKPKVNCIVGAKSVKTMTQFVRSILLADGITKNTLAAKLVAEWDMIKDEVAPLNAKKSCTTPVAAPTTTPCASPSSWSSPRPINNWWSC